VNNDSMHITNQRGVLQDNQCEEDFIRFIRSRLGLVIKSHQLYDLRKTIVDASEKFHCTPSAYLELIKTSGVESPYLEFLIAGITIGETYFFRDDHQMQLLSENVLPALIQSKRAANHFFLRIWSAGCASGEEIYTIAMLLREMLPDYQKWTLQLMGSDINTASLKKAREGIYGEWSMRSISDYYKNKYFNREKNQYHLHHDIRDAVNFMWLNLGSEDYPSMINNTNAQDLILCRNVLIYFDDHHVRNLMKKLDACLVEGAFLMLGASDPIQIKNTSLSSYQKEGALLMHSTAKKEEKRPEPSLSDEPLVMYHDTYQKRKPEKITLPPKISHKPKSDAVKSEIEKLMDESSWQDVINKLTGLDQNTLHQVDMLNIMATALANIGKLDDAVLSCEESLGLDKTQKQTWVTLAMVLIEKNQLVEAESALRKALFLDYQFVIAHLQLGLLLIRNGNIKKGLSSLLNALSITQSYSASKSVDGMKGMDYGRLADILKHDIELYTDKEQVWKK